MVKECGSPVERGVRGSEGTSVLLSFISSSSFSTRSRTVELCCVCVCRYVNVCKHVSGECMRIQSICVSIGGERRGQVQWINVFSWQHIRLVVSFPGLLHFCSLVCAQYNTWKCKSGKKEEGLNDHRWMDVRWS